MAKTYRRDDPVEPEGSGPEERGAQRRGRRRTWVNVAITVVAVVGILLGGVIIYLQTEAGRLRVEGIAVQQLEGLLTETAELRVDRVEGTFVTGAMITGVRVTEGGVPAIEIDTLYVRYNLTSLLRRRFSASTAQMSGARVWARQSEDGSWNLARILEPADEPAAEPTPWAVFLDEIGVRRGAVEVHFHHPDRDSVLTVAPLELDSRGFEFDSTGVRLQLDTLVAIAHPAVEEGVPVLLATSIDLLDEAAEVRSLLLESVRSDVRGSGIARLGEEFTFDGDLQAAPIDFADVRQFVDVPIFGAADIRLQAQGTPGDVVARLNADFHDHGDVALSGAFSTDPAGPARYVVDGSITNLNPGLLLGDPALAGTLTGTLDVDVGGPSLETISGDIDLQLRGSEFAQQQIVRADLVGEFETGRLDFTLGAALSGARILVSGNTAPFEEVIPYDLRGEVNDFNLAALTRDPDAQGSFRRGVFNISGAGFDPQTLRADGTIVVDALQFGDVTVSAARVNGGMRSGLLDFAAEADLGAGGGRISALGSARPLGEPLTYDITEAVLSGVNVAAVTGNPDHDSHLSGRLTLSGVGIDPETMQASFAARIDDSRWGAQSLPLADASGTLADGDLNLDAEVDFAEAGRASFTATAQPFAEPVAYDLGGTLQNLDLGALLEDPQHDSDLSGRFAARGVGIDPETLAATIEVELRDSRYRLQEFSTATVQASLDGGNVDGLLAATMPEGGVSLPITGRPFDDAPVIAVRDGSFTGVNVGLLLDAPDFQTNLAGSIDLDYGTSWDPGEASATGRITLAPSRINAATVESGLFELGLEDGNVSLVGAADFEQGEMGLVFAGRIFDEVPVYTLDARLDSLELMALVSPDGSPSIVNAEVEIEGTGFDPETMVLQARIDAEESLFMEGRLDALEADVVLDRGVLAANTFELRADFADASASGQVALFDTLAATNLHIVADVREAGPIDAFLTEQFAMESGAIEGSITGPAGGPLAVDLNAIVQSVTYGEFGARQLDARVNVEITPGRELDLDGRARLRFDFLSLPTFNIREGELTAAFIDEELSFEGSAAIDDDREIAFSAHVETEDDPAAEYHSALLLDDLNLRVGEERWELLLPARISIGDGAFLVRNFLLYSDDQQIAADGRVGAEGPLTLVLTAENVELDPFVDLIGYGDVGGDLTATIALLGDASDPEVEGLIQIDRLTSYDELVGALSATIGYEDQQLDIDALLTHVEGQTLEAEGFFPIAIRFDGVDEAVPDGAPVEFTLTSEGFPIEWAEPFLPPDLVEEIGGILQLDVTVGGTEGAPELAGQANLSDGVLAMEVTGDVRFQDITLGIDFEGNVARVTRANINDGRGGSLSLDGTITLPQLSVGELDLDLVLDEFRAIDTETYRELVLDASPGQNLRFSGTLVDPVLTGNVTLSSGDIYLTEELMGPDLEAVELTATQIQRIEEVFGMRVVAADTSEATFMQNLDLDIGVTIERNVWIRGRQNVRLDVEFFGSLDVVKPPQGDFQIFGSIEVIRGRVEMPTLAGRAFNIGTIEDTYGEVVFNGPISEAIVDLQAGLQAAAGLGRGISATVYLGFSGRLAGEPELTLSSDPQMETADIACVVATGRPCGEAFEGRVAEEIAFAQLGSLVQGLAAQQLGLDVVEVEQRPTGEIVLTLGSYVSNRVFAAVSQPITEPRTADQTVSRTPEVMIEYELLRWLLARVERRNVGGTGGALIFQFEY